MDKTLLIRFFLLVFFSFSINAYSQNLPANGSLTVTCNTTIYDNGGPSGQYSNNADSYAFILGKPGTSINISGTYDTENNYDYIYVYSDAGTVYTLDNTGSINYTAPTGSSITVAFYSDGGVVDNGFAFNISYSGGCPSPVSTVNISGSGTTNFACGSEVVLKDHAGDARYSNNRDDYRVLNNTGTSPITITGSFATEGRSSGYYDYVRIYAGSGIGGSVLATYEYNGTINYTGNPGQTLTVYFHSDGGTVDEGFALNVTCECIPSVAPTSITGTSTICTGDVTTLTTSGGSLGDGAEDVWYEGGCVNEVFTQEWSNQPYSTPNTTVNSVSNGILTVTSNNGDPMINMSGLGSFNPNIYRYISIRYRVTSGTAGNTEIFFYNSNHNYAVGGETGFGSLISDNQWHILNIDMHQDPQYTTGGNILGWRYDWATAAGVTMQLDYITLSDRPIYAEGASVSVSPSSSTTYYAAKKGECGTTTCASKTVTVNTCAPPSISNFTPNSACIGSGATITINGSYFNALSSVTVNGQAASVISSNASTILVTLPASSSGSGNIVVTTSSGSDSHGTFTVNPLPVINSQPQALKLCEDGSGSFSVSAAGSGHSYQWQYSATPSNPSSWANTNGVTGLSGHTSSTLGLSNALAAYNGAYLRCVVTKNGCPTISSNALLTVVTKPTGGNIPTTDFCAITGNGTVSVNGVSNATQYSWSLPSGLSGSSTASNINVSGNSNGSYSVSVTPINVSDATSCPANTAITGTVNIVDAPGNPSVFGNNVWNVYAYLGTNRDNLAALDYAGYYTQNLSPQQGFNTAAEWVNTLSPSDASNYQGCVVPANGHTFVHKRQGFTPGYYTISMDNWDDGSILYVNGTEEWRADYWSGDVANNGYAAPFVLSNCIYLDGNSTIEFRTAEAVGGSNAQITLTQLIPLLANTSPTSPTSCTDASAIDLTPSGGSGSYSYNWSGPGSYSSTAQDISSLGIGTYLVTVSDNNCSALTATGSEDVNSLLLADAGPDLYLPCNGSVTVEGSSNNETLYSESFGNTDIELSNSTSGWRIHYLYSSHPGNRTRWFISNASGSTYNFNCPTSGSGLVQVDDRPSSADIPCDYAWDDGTMDEIAYNTNPIDTRFFTSVNLSFDYMAGGEYDNYNGGTAWDYFQVMYSLDNGATWVALNEGNSYSPNLNRQLNGTNNAFFSLNYGTPQFGSANINMPAAVVGGSFLLGFRWVNDGNTGVVDNMMIDNIEVTGTADYSWSGNGIASGGSTSSPVINQPGTYTMNVTAGNGCTHSDEVVVSEIQIPAVPEVSNGGVICEGSAAELIAGGMALGGKVAELSGTDNMGGGLLSSASNNFTMEFWAKPARTRLFTAETNSGIVPSLGSNAQSLVIYPGHGGASNAGSGVSVGINGISVNEHGSGYFPSPLVHDMSISDWTHIAVVYSNKTPSLYVNGVFVKTGLQSSRAIVYPSFGTGTGYGYYNGQLDNIRIWNDVRTPGEIVENMHLEAPLNNTGLIAHYNFDASNGNNSLSGFNMSSNGVSYQDADYYTYTWSGSSAPVASTNESQNTSTLNSTQSYSVIASVNGCSGISSVATSVVVTPGDPANNLTDNLSICEGMEKQLSATPAGGSWSVISGSGSIYGNIYSTGSFSADETVTIRYSVNGGGVCPNTSEDISFTADSDNNSSSSWTGAENNDWHNPKNWSNCLPGNNTDVVIPAAPTNQPVVYANGVNMSNGTGECNTIEVQGGASITIKSNAVLKVND